MDLGQALSENLTKIEERFNRPNTPARHELFDETRKGFFLTRRFLSRPIDMRPSVLLREANLSKMGAVVPTSFFAVENASYSTDCPPAITDELSPYRFIPNGNTSQSDGVLASQVSRLASLMHERTAIAP